MKKKFWKILLKTLTWLGGSLALAVVYYLVFMVVFPTDLELRLAKENAMYRDEIAKVEENINLMGEEIDYLESRDGVIYKHLFNSDVPRENESSEFGSVSDITQTMASVEENLKAIYELAPDGKAFSKLPVIAPLDGLHWANVGASTGRRMSPFYKVGVPHDGVDLMASAGTPVRATASGVVVAVRKSAGGLGNVVELSHEGGLVTRYAHLSEILVKKGKRVKAGDIVGLVGDSGRTFATHLHYEILKDGKPLDPLTFFVLSNGPQEYFNMMLNGASTGQSMD